MAKFIKSIKRGYKLKKIIVLIFAICSLGFGAKFDLKPSYNLILNTNQGSATIIDNDSFIVGSSGIVLHKLKDGSKTIIARAVVTSKKDGYANLRFELFDQLKQTALPLPTILPQAGDEVILNFMYNRSLIVVPNKEIYDQVTKAFSNIDFIHPDIIAAYLSYEYKPNPSRSDFRKMCAQNAAGLIFIALDNEAVFADCGSFEVLHKFKTGSVGYYELPFYTRIKNIDTVFWKLDGAKIGNYDKYYKKLLAR